MSAISGSHTLGLPLTQLLPMGTTAKAQSATTTEMMGASR